LSRGFLIFFKIFSACFLPVIGLPASTGATRQGGDQRLKRKGGVMCKCLFNPMKALAGLERKAVMGECDPPMPPAGARGRRPSRGQRR